jgi:hypothetical protein
MRVKSIVAVFLVFMLLLATGMAFAEDMTITGELNDASQIVTASGDVYDVVDDEKGADLAANIGKTVEVKGTLAEQDGVKSITVIEFKVLD